MLKVVPMSLTACLKISVLVMSGLLLAACGGAAESPSAPDELPVFGDLVFSIAENSAAGTELGALYSGTSSLDGYSWQIASGNDAGFFSLDGDVLEVSSAASLDFETQSSYSLQIRVSDSNGASELLNVAITVLDIEPETQTLLDIVAANPRFRTDHFSGSSNCGVCHNQISDKDGNDVSIESEWGRSVMAHAAKDPFWRAKVATEIFRNPHLEAELSDTCTRCHAPMANVEYQARAQAVDLFGTNGVLDPQSFYYSPALDGVSCTLCHQISDQANLGELESFSGGYVVENLAVSGERPAYGQYASPLVNPMLNETGFRPTHSAHIAGSEVCGTCHNLKTPFVDAAGQVLSSTPESEFPEQMIYSEWEHSEFEDSRSNPQSCQDCHMQKADGVVLANRPNGMNQPPARDDFSRHGFLGANITLLELLNGAADQLAVQSDGLAQSIAETQAFLQSSASLQIHNVMANPSSLSFDLQINNHSGHKLPAGYPARRVFVELIVEDAGGATVFHAGEPQADGRISGVDSDDASGAYEPHRNLISSAAEVPVYQSVMHNSDNQLTHTLLRAAGYLKDNRLLPAGFDKSSAAADIAVIGQAASDADFTAGGDTLSYQLPLSVGSGAKIIARLHYQSFSYGFLQDLLQQRAEVAEAQRLYELLQSVNPALTQQIAEQQYTLP